MKVLARVLTGTALATSLFSPVFQSQPAFAAGTVQHVLLLSVDGLHAVDLANCISANLMPKP